MLGETKIDISNRFATKAQNAFNELQCFKGPNDSIFFYGCVAVIEAKVENIYTGGNHTIFVGSIECADVYEKRALVYYQGTYHQVKPISIESHK